MYPRQIQWTLSQFYPWPAAVHLWSSPLRISSVTMTNTQGLSVTARSIPQHGRVALPDN